MSGSFELVSVVSLCRCWASGGNGLSGGSSGSSTKLRRMTSETEPGADRRTLRASL